jgi:hypothetical protein
MADSETPSGDALEQLQDPSDAQAAVGAGDPEVALEASEADAVDQQTSLDDDEPAGSSDDRPWDADEGDLAESSRQVGYDDEDYR